jgi:hypothetical protein
MSVGLIRIACSNSLDHYWRERILVLEAHIVISYHGECLEEIFTVDADDVFLSFDRSREAR